MLISYYNMTQNNEQKKVEHQADVLLYILKTGQKLKC